MKEAGACKSSYITNKDKKMCTKPGNNLRWSIGMREQIRLTSIVQDSMTWTTPTWRNTTTTIIWLVGYGMMRGTARWWNSTARLTWLVEDAMMRANSKWWNILQRRWPNLWAMASDGGILLERQDRRNFAMAYQFCYQALTSPHEQIFAVIRAVMDNVKLWRNLIYRKIKTVPKVPRPSTP